VPFVLCQREDFTFEDVVEVQKPPTDEETTSAKKRTLLYFDIVAPHMAERYRRAKLIRLEKKAKAPKAPSTFERGSSS